MNQSDAKWAIFLKGKVIPIGDKTMESIQRDPTDIMGYYEMEAMEAWKNLFPLTEVSARLGYLPMADEAWIMTPNPYWHFLMDKPKFPPLIAPLSQSLNSPLWKPLCEKSLSVLESIHLEPTISQRKVLLNRPIELMLMGNLFTVKLLQFSMAPITCTLNILCNQAQFGILKHAVTLFPEIIREKILLRQAWTLRETGEEPSPTWFDSRSSPSSIMNILIWNCRGAMKPTFLKTALDLVEWHQPVIFIITETRLDGPRADGIIRKLPFDGAYSTETIGFAGGIWLLWRSDSVSLDILSATEQEIHAIVQVRSFSQHWLLSAIYGSPRFREMCILWNNLRVLSVRHNLPWAVMGDFNDVTKEEEKKGGNGICRKRVFKYTDCMDFCNLLDLGFSGSIFTWTNKRDISGLIQQRLDRVWANSDWKAIFPEAMVKHLARINSDHCPLLLSLAPNFCHSWVRPFRFQPMWLSHEGFPSIVRDAWEGNHHNFNNAITSFTQKVKIWNKDVFGNIFWKKKNLIARILGVEKALCRYPSQSLINLHKSLSEELEHILNLEEELWGIKARSDWLI